MKLPKGFNKWLDEDKRKWVGEELRKKRIELDELTKLSRLLVADTGFKPIVDERLDLLEMKK